MASTLSPSVTATSRMFSPNRAMRPPSQSCRARRRPGPRPDPRLDARSPIQWPATIVRSSRSRAAMNPNSRSPWAAWLRFMKSMSMVAHGMSRWYCVCRWRNGLCSPCRPAIHILAGEKVCIHRISPTQAGSRSASWHSARIPPASVRTGLTTTRAGMPTAASRAAAMSALSSATCSSVSGPYRCWLPVTNQTSAGGSPTTGRRRGGGCSSLAVHLRVALVEPLDEVGRDRLGRRRAGGRGTSLLRRPRS